MKGLEIELCFISHKKKENGSHHEWFWWESWIIKKKSRKKPCESFEGMGPKENLKSARQTFIKSQFAVNSWDVFANHEHPAHPVYDIAHPN